MIAFVFTAAATLTANIKNSSYGDGKVGSDVFFLHKEGIAWTTKLSVLIYTSPSIFGAVLTSYKHKSVDWRNIELFQT